MNKELEKIQQRSAEIMQGYPEKISELRTRLKDARIQKAAAETVLEEATSFDGYDNAEKGVKRAELAVKFIEKEMERLETSPRMAEAEYEKAVATCRGIMDKAIKDWRKKAAALMDDLYLLTEGYCQTAEETNETLKKLDAAANVLQSRHQYEIRHLQGAPDQSVRNKQIWLKHALRYDNARYIDLATAPEPEDKAAQPHVHADSVLDAAWKAVKKGYPRRAF